MFFLIQQLLNSNFRKFKFRKGTKKQYQNVQKAICLEEEEHQATKRKDEKIMNKK